jgi:hypothetical protein
MRAQLVLRCLPPFVLLFRQAVSSFAKSPSLPLINCQTDVVFPYVHFSASYDLVMSATRIASTAIVNDALLLRVRL